MSEGGRRRTERVEVRRSREKILKAAEDFFATRKTEPTMSELAISAGVGNATLYRRFPSIEAVIVALHERLMEHFEAVAADALACPTGWEAVVTTVNGIARAMAEHPAIPVVYRRMALIDDGYRIGPRWDAPLKRITKQAQDEGMLRPDVVANDITYAAFRLGEFASLPEPARSAVLGRQLVIIIDGLRAQSASTPMPGEGPSTELVNRLVHHEARRP